MDDSCAVCADALEWVAYGPCGHREVCSTCVVRLRFVLNDRRCCICNTAAPIVFVTKALGDHTRVVTDFSVFPANVTEGQVGQYWYHEDTQAFFDDVDHHRMIKAMCRLSCSVCDKSAEEQGSEGTKRRQRFRSIEQLKGHLFHQHRLFMCSLCLEGRKVFICEQKLYTRSQLNQHTSTGDSEVDGSESERGGFMGHPMCESCRNPFYGENELYLHMSTEHYTCHICQRQHPGQYDYYRNYDDLEMHFRQEHFLCENEACLAKKFVVFQTEAEMKRHNTMEHGGHMSRSKRNAALQNNLKMSFDCQSSSAETSRGESTFFRKRKRLVLVDGGFVERHVVSRCITNIFKMRVDPEGYCWDHVTEEVREFYWTEFQKEFEWDPDMTPLIKRAWSALARNRYSDNLCHWRRASKRPIHISDAIWADWQQKWEDPVWLRKSAIASSNRRSEKAGQGTGLSCHTAGSISIEEHRRRLRLKKGVEPEEWQLFKATHTRKDGSWVDTRSQQVGNRVDELMSHATQSLENEGSTVDLSPQESHRIFLEAVGAQPNDRRVYGMGAKASAFFPRRGSSSSNFGDSGDMERSITERVRSEFMTEIADIRRKHREERLRYEQQLQEMRQEEHHRYDQQLQEMRQLVMRLTQSAQFSDRSSAPDDPPVDQQ